MNKHLHPNKSRGFTLIELLIVIAIIGILAAVLIAVINPVKQQNRARDGATRATMNKMALAANAYYSAFGSFPNCPTLLADLNNASIAGTCTAATGDITITGSPQNIHYNQLSATSSCIRSASLETSANAFVWTSATGVINIATTAAAATTCP